MTSVAIASDGWDLPGTAMHNLAVGLVSAARGAGVEVTELPLPNYSDGRRRGGIVEPVVRCLFTGYPPHGSSLVHNAGWPPNGRRGAAVASFHDLWAFRDPGRGAALKRMAYRAMARRARTIVALSGYTRSEVGRFLGARAEEKTVVVPVPVEPPPRLPEIEKRFDALWVGADLPRKALGFLLAEARRAPDLVFAVRWTKVRAAGASPEVARALAPAPPPNVVQYTERLSDEDLDRLYASSRCVVSTSTYEGFHLPILEAYLRGVPAVVPDEEPYRGLYGRATGIHYFDRAPGSDRPLAGAIRAAATQPPFEPDARVRAAVAPRTVGAQLRGIYEALARR